MFKQQSIFDIFSEYKNKALYPLLVGAFAVFPLLISGTVLTMLESGGWVLDSNSLWHMLVFFGVAAFAMSAALIPTTFVAILSGYYWGWPGMAGVLLSYPIAAIIGLYLGRYIFIKTGQDFSKQVKYKKLISGLEEKPLAMLIFARLSPVLPFAMSNLLLGQMKIPLPSYLLGTLLGMLPRTLFFFFLGTQAKEIIEMLKNPNANQSAQLLSILLLLISAGGLLWVGQRAWKRMLES